MNSPLQAAPAPLTLGSADSPRARATQFHELIQEIDAAMGASMGKVTEIEQRGYLDNLFSSSRDDLIAHARSQNQVNTLLVKLHQQTIALNTMGYAYLASVIAEFERQVNEGSKDRDGKIHVLSGKGKEVARMATVMFNAILDTSQLTQERIDANTAAVLDHDGRLGELARAFSQQSNRISSFERFQEIVEDRLEELADGALRYEEALATWKGVIDELVQQQASVVNELNQLERGDALLRAELAALRGDMAFVVEREDTLRKQLRRTIWTLWPAVVVMVGLCGAAFGHVFGLV
jgi:chromosome segregation ATPase